MIKGKIKVDSCRISIPLVECEIIDTNLIDRIHTQSTNTFTGEIIKEAIKHGEPTVIENTDGTFLKFWKENQFFYANGVKTPTLYITFLINSKHLGKRYFEGITQHTLKDIHRYIESFKIVSFPFSSLYNARYNDTDICIDFSSTASEFEALKENLKKLTIMPNNWHTAKNKNNSGIWTPTKDKPRENAKPSAPFVKFYSKEEDFTYQSTSFALTYLNQEQYKDLYRIEVTVKNSKHKEHLGISKVSKFGEFLKLDLQLIMQDIVKVYFEKEKRLMLKENNLTPTDKVIIDLLNLAISKGANKEELYKLFNRNDVSREARKTLKEKFHKYTSLDEFNREQMELNTTTKDVFSYLGIDVKK
jgi:hypothetical protein